MQSETPINIERNIQLQSETC